MSRDGVSGVSRACLGRVSACLGMVSRDGVSGCLGVTRGGVSGKKNMIFTYHTQQNGLPLREQ